MEQNPNGRLGGSPKPYNGFTITLKRLAKQGYQSLLDHYLKVSPSDIEPPYTRPVRTVV